MKNRFLSLAFENGLLRHHKLAVHHLPDALRALVVEQALRSFKSLGDGQIMILANMPSHEMEGNGETPPRRTRSQCLHLR